MVSDFDTDKWDIIARDHNSGQHCDFASSPHNCSQHPVAERKESGEAVWTLQKKQMLCWTSFILYMVIHNLHVLEHWHRLMVALVMVV